MADKLEDVTISIFTRGLNLPHTRKCLECIPDNVRTLVFVGDQLFTVRKENGVLDIEEKKSIPELAGKGFNFSRDCNITAKYSDTSWTLLLNDDCFLEPDAIRKMLQRAIDTGAKIIGGFLFYPDGKPQSLGLFIIELDLGPFRAKEVLRSDVGKIVPGALLLVDTSILRSVKFDEYLDFGYDDADFCYRARNKGIGIAFAEDAKATHVVNASVDSTRVRLKRTISMLKFYKRHPEFINGSILLVSFYLLYTATFEIRITLSRYAPGLFGRLKVARNRALRS